MTTRITLGSSEDVDAAVKAARAAFETFSRTTPKERAALLERIIEEYKTRVPDRAKAISREMGCPISVAQTAQAGSGAAHLGRALAALKEFSFHERVGANAVVREPIGVVALITPWN